MVVPVKKCYRYRGTGLLAGEVDKADKATDKAGKAMKRCRTLIAGAAAPHVVGYRFARLLRSHSMRRRKADDSAALELFPRLPFSPHIRAWSGRLTASLAVS